MDVRELYDYKMTPLEIQKWDMIKRQIIRDCQFLQIPLEFHEIIEEKTNSVNPYFHEAGYCATVGYFYIIIGDRGALSLKCSSPNPGDMRWYLLQEIASHVGQQMELAVRLTEEQNWRYKRTFTNGKLAFAENKNWLYNTVHDTRKFWFEYAINLLSRVFSIERLQPYVNERINYMNKWFNQPHWDFDWQKMCFVEISNSQERD